MTITIFTYFCISAVFIFQNQSKMSNSSYDALWHDAMGELHEQLYVEGVGDEDLTEGPKGVCEDCLEIFY